MNLTEDMIGLGKENTVTREQLCLMTGLSDSTMRMQLQKLKEKGVVICSSCNREGYFRPRRDNPEEMEIARHDYLERERKAKAMLKQLKAYRKFVIGDDQLELF